VFSCLLRLVGCLSLSRLLPLSVVVTEEETDWFDAAWQELSDAYHRGKTELLLPLNTHHLRHAYEREKIETYQEYPLGFWLVRLLQRTRELSKCQLPKETLNNLHFSQTLYPTHGSNIFFGAMLDL